MLTESEQIEAMVSLREMPYEDTQEKPNIFECNGNRITVKPIPMWANHTHERNSGIDVAYGSWGYERVRVS